MGQLATSIGTRQRVLGTKVMDYKSTINVNGELQRSEAKRDVMALVIAALDWKAQFEEKGWA